MTETDDHSLVPVHLAVKAMRDNGYKTAAHALAELIDNSVQAGAGRVELLCEEQELVVNRRTSRRVKRIAVLDNGKGMSSKLLREALQFGNGSRLDDRSGIGRFGMGLPNSSISQCRRVDVWSWTAGSESANHCYIDLTEVENGSFKNVPVPDPLAIPASWISASKGLGNSGTLVVWSDLDRCQWKTGSAIIDNSEFLIGRMYRKFLESGKVEIRLTTFDADSPKRTFEDRPAIANDPGYLMSETSTPDPWNSTPMFSPDGDLSSGCSQIVKIPYEDRVHDVKLTFSIAKEAARSTANAGSLPHGKHAKKNVGVSLLRAGRELDLDLSAVNNYDPRERWWGVEVDFPPSLDELFGVTNDKQSARNFSDVTSKIDEILNENGKSVAKAKEELALEDDPRGPLVELAHMIDRRLRTIRETIRVQTRVSPETRRQGASAERHATEATRILQQEGAVGESDKGADAPIDERKRELEDDFVKEGGLSPEEAKRRTDDIFANDLKYVFAQGPIEGSSFFSVRPVAGEIVVRLNTNHPAYTNLIEVLSELDEESHSLASSEDLRDRLRQAGIGLRLLLLAWARFEDEQTNLERRTQLQDIRSDWGRYAAKFLEGSL
jgi:hypothetical protein